MLLKLMFSHSKFQHPITTPENGRISHTISLSKPKVGDFKKKHAVLVIAGSIL